jgi:hypothetical protein
MELAVRKIRKCTTSVRESCAVRASSPSTSRRLIVGSRCLLIRGAPIEGRVTLRPVATSLMAHHRCMLKSCSSLRDERRESGTVVPVLERQDMKMYVRTGSGTFLTSVRDGDEWLALRSGRFNFGTH